MDDFARRHPIDTVRWGREVFVAAEVAPNLIDEAERRGIGILGLEGFIIGDAPYPAISRIATFARAPEYPSDDFVEWSCREARRLLAGPWRSPPSGPADQISSEARGRHMLAVSLDEPSA